MSHVWVIEYKGSDDNWHPFEMGYTRREGREMLKFSRYGYVNKKFRLKKYVRAD